MDSKPANTNDPESLEKSSDDDANSLESAPKDSQQPTKSPQKEKVGVGRRIVDAIMHVNIYLLIFILIVVLSGGIVIVAYQRNRKAAAPTTITTTTLSQDTLNQLKGSDATVGDPKQTLTIESNAIFSGQVLVRSSLEVAGSLKVGGSLSIPNLSVTGQATFDQLQANSLAITGNAAIQGQLSVQKGITTSGGGTFGGAISTPQLTTQSLQLSSDLIISKHIYPSGVMPGKSDGSALGNGGTSSVSGTDTAGTVTINTGGSPAVGCFVTVNFSSNFGGTPHIVITPVGSAAAGLNYYITRTSRNFSICTTNSAPAGQTFSFDYIAFD